MEEKVILVNDSNLRIGTMLKSEVHGAETPLHRAFSCYVFNSEGKFLIQQRSFAKITWPGIWSNSFCGHPLPGESLKRAIQRRAKFELGIDGLTSIKKEFPYRYCETFQGVMENEICPVFTALYDGPILPNPDEVAQFQWVDWDDFVKGVKDQQEPFYKALSPWCCEQTNLLQKQKDESTWVQGYMNG